jgi:hypothetical protein
MVLTMSMECLLKSFILATCGYIPRYYLQLLMPSVRIFSTLDRFSDRRYHLLCLALLLASIASQYIISGTDIFFPFQFFFSGGGA